MSTIYFLSFCFFLVILLRALLKLNHASAVFIMSFISILTLQVSDNIESEN